MIHEDIQLTGSFQASGSFTLPNHATSESIANPTTGSMYNDTTDNVVKLYNGTEWVTVGSQTGSAAGGGGADIEYLLVAGGAAGGGGSAYFNGGGGGGAGGYLSASLSSVTSGSSFTITVGGGGTGDTNDGNDGSDSTITKPDTSVVTAVGGGGGAAQTINSGNGRDGGSGGGGNASNSPGGSGTVGQGNDGGAGPNSDTTGGGGGGAGEVGADGTASGGGDGGDGKQSSITGTSTYYAGGGGGGTYPPNNEPGGTGGQGGGGDGRGGSTQGAGSSATANTGGGGGGAAMYNDAQNGGSGGSGVAIFAYNTSSLSGLGGTKTLNGGRMVHTFNSSGTLTISSAGDYPVAPSSVFAPVLYTATGTTQNITSLNFQPDLVWIKDRGTAESHQLFDSIRGAGKVIESDDSTGEVTRSDGFTSFNSNGFTLGADSGGFVNYTGRGPYVAWCWKAGGTAVSNTDGDITSTVSANTDAGFSIVKYTGNGTSGQTVGHGLSSTPQLTIIKNLDSATNWDVSFDGISGGTSLNLDETNAVFSPTQGYHVAGASTLTLNSGGVGILRVNNSADNYIAYCWHSVPGYSKVGTYTGDGGSSNAINLGFQPRWVMIKLSSTTGQNWYIMDDQRDDTSVEKALSANLSSVEESLSNHLDFTSTGFTLTKSSGAFNTNGSTYLYLAFA